MWLRSLRRSLVQFIFSGVVMRCFPWLTVFSSVAIAWDVQTQTSRANSAASYFNRGNDWLTKGELDLAIALISRDSFNIHNANSLARAVIAGRLD